MRLLIAAGCALALAGCAGQTPQMVAGKGFVVSYTTLDAVAAAIDPYLKDRTIHGAEAQTVHDDLTGAQKALDNADAIRLGAMAGDMAAEQASAASMIADLQSILAKHKK